CRCSRAKASRRLPRHKPSQLPRTGKPQKFSVPWVTQANPTSQARYRLPEANESPLGVGVVFGTNSSYPALSCNLEMILPDRNRVRLPKGNTRNPAKNFWDNNPEIAVGQPGSYNAGWGSGVSDEPQLEAVVAGNQDVGQEVPLLPIPPWLLRNP